MISAADVTSCESSWSRVERVTGSLACHGVLIVLTTACPGEWNSRTTPICAEQDCKTGEILDDGCAADGKCKSCINDCGGRVAPRNGPAEPAVMFRVR